MEKVRASIRTVPDFPEPGIQFKDITPVLNTPDLFKRVIDHLCDRYAGQDIARIAGVDARGFIFGAALAHRLHKGFIPVRKTGKLPYKTIDKSYDLEYGSNSLSIHVDALEKGERILIVDDLLATGGTLAASAHLVEQLGGIVHEIVVLVELGFLEGRKKLEGYPFYAPIVY